MNPYPGLRPFRPEEANLFMGREIVSGTVATRVRVSPLTLMFARSGVGKSSFLTCRLIPTLGGASQIRYLNEWGTTAPELLIDHGVKALEHNGKAVAEKPVLILDQFEDIFKFPYDRDNLWDKLAELVNISDPPVHLLISMREEWLGAWEEANGYLPDALNSMVRLAPLTRNELTRAIKR